MNKLHFKTLSKFMKYRKNYLDSQLKNYTPYKTSTIDDDLKFREDAEYNDLEERLRRHGIMEKIDGLKPAEYLEKTMDISLKENNK